MIPLRVGKSYHVINNVIKTDYVMLGESFFLALYFLKYYNNHVKGEKEKKRKHTN